MMQHDDTNRFELAFNPGAEASRFKSKPGPGMAKVFPALTVIIPTKNRSSDLGIALESLFLQTVLPQQLIIVDQSETDESMRRFDAICAAADPRVWKSIAFLYILDAGITGLAAARNRAMQCATGEVLLFLDDDVELEMDFVEELLKVYVNFPQFGGVSGIITNYHPPHWPFRFWTRLFVRGPFHDDRQWIYWNADRLRWAEAIPVTRMGGSLMSFRAPIIRGILFDESLRGVSDGEDVDFCEQMRRKTIMAIAPGARLKHLLSPAGRTTEHPLWRPLRASHFLYWKNWNHGIKNPLCFIWLNMGFILLALLASLRRVSLKPIRTFFKALRANSGLQAGNLPSGPIPTPATTPFPFFRRIHW